MKLPGPLAALDLGEEPLGHLRTAGQIPFVSDDGEDKRTSIWFVVCPTRCWLVAATTEDQWSVGDTAVDLDKGWTWDALRVGAWSTPLRSGTRKKAKALLEQWAKAEQGGSAVPAPRPDHSETRAPAAAGALNVPDWIRDRVPADPEARWLFAFETGREVPCVAKNGKLQELPLWFAISDQQIVIAADGPVHPFVRVLEPPITLRKRTAARDLLVSGAWELPGALVDRMTPLAHELAEADKAPRRWSVAIRQALDLGEPDRAIALLREAFVLDRHGASWAWVGVLAIDRDPSAATGAAIHRLDRVPDLDLEAEAVAWAHRRDTARDAQTALPAGILAECRVPERPDGLPWPPNGPIEAIAVAALLGGRPEDALALWGSRGDTPRVRQAIAAWAASSDSEDASDAWWEAAQRLREPEPELAREALDRAIALASDDPAPLHWRAAAWAHADGRDPTPHWDAALPAPPPPDLEQPIEAWRDVANRAEESGGHEAAVAAYRQIRKLDGADRAALASEAKLLEDPLGRLSEAIDALRFLAERTEAAVEPDPARWVVWTEIARLLHALDEAEGRDTHPEALAALKEAVRGDFLVPAAYERALELGSGFVPTAELDWWRHLIGRLTGSGGGVARMPERSLRGEALDGLHPGGVGWLERARQSLDTSEPPPIADLTRGLERIQPGKWPVVAATLSSLSEALGIESPATYLFRGDGAWGMSAWPTEPPIVLVGADHLETEGEHPLAMSREALAFGLAVELVHLAARHPLLAFDGGLVGTSRSVYQAFGKYAGAAETVVDMVTLLPGVDQIAKIQTVIKLSRRVFTARSVVDKTTNFAETTRGLFGWSGDQQTHVGRRFQGPALQFRIQADRAALVLTGDLDSALEAILKGQPDTAGQLDKARSDGLLAVIETLDEDTAMRVASLLEFAAAL